MFLHKLTAQEVIGFKTDIIADLDKCIESLMNITSDLRHDDNAKIIWRTMDTYYRTVKMYNGLESEDSDQAIIASDDGATSDIFDEDSPTGSPPWDSDGEQLFHDRYYPRNNFHDSNITKRLMGLDDSDDILDTLDSLDNLGNSDNLDSSVDPRDYDNMIDPPDYDLFDRNDQNNQNVPAISQKELRPSTRSKQVKLPAQRNIFTLCELDVDVVPTAEEAISYDDPVIPN
jgi:hypothetical protein